MGWNDLTFLRLSCRLWTGYMCSSNVKIRAPVMKERARALKSPLFVSSISRCCCRWKAGVWKTSVFGAACLIPLQVRGTFARRLSSPWRYNSGRHIKRNTNSNRSSAGPVRVGQHFLWSVSADMISPEASISFNVDQLPAQVRPHNHHQVAVKAKLSTVTSTWQGATFLSSTSYSGLICTWCSLNEDRCRRRSPGRSGGAGLLTWCSSGVPLIKTFTLNANEPNNLLQSQHPQTN